MWEIIASRFSKIGSLPKLEETNLISVLEGSIQYMNKRASSKIAFELVSDVDQVNVMMNKDLFEWVVENIIKNSVDAINEKGAIIVKIKENDKNVFVDIIDDGRGLKKVFFKEIFEPGFTSKKRGWGLGLSLVKRIMKDYHRGQVSVLKSIPNKETIVRLVLNK